MTASITIMVKDRCSLETLAACVAAQLGISLRKTHQEKIGDSFTGDLFDGCYVDIFDDHGFEDDQGIPFTEYKLAVDFAVLDKWEYGSGKERIVSIALALSKAIANTFGTRCLLVDDLQLVLAAIEPEVP